MKDYLFLAVEYIAFIHDSILKLNDGISASFSDKELHFLVIGVLGMLLFFLIHPIFRALARHGHEIVISWFYVFTLIVVITFAIEVGQQVSGTGSMEFYDIVSGVIGFLSMFAVFAVLRGIVLLIVRARRRSRQERSRAKHLTGEKHESEGTQ